MITYKSWTGNNPLVDSTRDTIVLRWKFDDCVYPLTVRHRVSDKVESPVVPTENGSVLRTLLQQMSSLYDVNYLDTRKVNFSGPTTKVYLRTLGVIQILSL